MRVQVRQCFAELHCPPAALPWADTLSTGRRGRRTSLKFQLEIDATEVTNAEFARFVKATGYVTDAERLQPGFEQSGGVVFRPPTLENPSWWHFVEGANWRTPEGPENPISTAKTRPHEPVVQVSFNDARAYAAWAGRRLPNETEWEYAANAGADTQYVWGDERAPGGVEMANTWQGTFPIQNTQADGYAKRSPVGCFPANAFGLYDMIGNVWEWTTRWPPKPNWKRFIPSRAGRFYARRIFVVAIAPRPPSPRSRPADQPYRISHRVEIGFICICLQARFNV